MSDQNLLHSPVLSPDLQPDSWISAPFETYLSIPFLYYLIDAIIRKWTVPFKFPSCIFPVSDSGFIRFLFVRSINWSVLRSFKMSDARNHHFSYFVLNCGSYSIVTVRCCLTLPVECTFLSSFHLSQYSSCQENGSLWEKSGKQGFLWLSSCGTVLWNSSHMNSSVELNVYPFLPDQEALCR